MCNAGTDNMYDVAELARGSCRWTLNTDQILQNACQLSTIDVELTEADHAFLNTKLFFDRQTTGIVQSSLRSSNTIKL